MSARDMCPHCGAIVEVFHGLTAFHDWPKPFRQLCPGSRQIPRNPESDRRPLWKDDTKPAQAAPSHGRATCADRKER